MKTRRPTADDVPALLDSLIVNIDGHDYRVFTSSEVPAGQCRLTHDIRRNCSSIAVNREDPARLAVALVLAAVAQADPASGTPLTVATATVTPRYWRRT